MIFHKLFGEASLASGASAMQCGVVPNAMAPLLAQTTLAVSCANLPKAGLSFLGTGP